ncbi:hypothetical protein V6N00_12790 [Tersicoccus sp. MR15.9]|uniref:hypothetical protein n=1 Tax=Tersicoccus mangrovi TaxID=3121635 RepID=UPI002FE57D0C
MSSPAHLTTLHWVYYQDDFKASNNAFRQAAREHGLLGPNSEHACSTGPQMEDAIRNIATEETEPYILVISGHGIHDPDDDDWNLRGNLRHATAVYPRVENPPALLVLSSCSSADATLRAPGGFWSQTLPAGTPVIGVEGELRKGKKLDGRWAWLGWSALYEGIVPDLCIPASSSITLAVAQRIVESTLERDRDAGNTDVMPWLAFAVEDLTADSAAA